MHDEFFKRLNQPPAASPSDPLPETLETFLRIQSTIAARLTDAADLTLTAHEQAIQNIFWLVAEVSNGGFHQYLFNSSGDQILNTLRSLQSIGATETFAILSDVCSLLFPDGQPRTNRGERQTQLEEFEDAATGDLLPIYEQAFDEFDQRFSERTEELYSLSLTYWHTRDSDPANRNVQ